MSPAACGRGLKLSNIVIIESGTAVARRVRAWIETSRVVIFLSLVSVARRVRAWIETSRAIRNLSGPFVARRVRAWIETMSLAVVLAMTKSRPPRAGVD